MIYILGFIYAIGGIIFLLCSFISKIQEDEKYKTIEYFIKDGYDLEWALEMKPKDMRYDRYVLSFSWFIILPIILLTFKE